MYFALYCTVPSRKRTWNKPRPVEERRSYFAILLLSEWAFLLSDFSSPAKQYKNHKESERKHRYEHLIIIVTEQRTVNRIRGSESRRSACVARRLAKIAHRETWNNLQTIVMCRTSTHHTAKVSVGCLLDHTPKQYAPLPSLLTPLTFRETRRGLSARRLWFGQCWLELYIREHHHCVLEGHARACCRCVRNVDDDARMVSSRTCDWLG